jgi:hypothetical protein
LKFIDAIKLDVHFGRSFLNGIYQKRTRALREMTETACEFTGKFGMMMLGDILYVFAIDPKIALGRIIVLIAIVWAWKLY